MAVLRLVLLLLASIQACPVMASEEQLVEAAESVLAKGTAWALKKEGSPKGAKGVTMGYKFYKNGHKILDQTDKKDPAGGGAGGTRYNVAIDTVVINDGTGPSKFPVLMPDITAPASVIGGSCGPGPLAVQGLRRPSKIVDLRGYGNTVSLMTGGARPPLCVTLPACSPGAAAVGFAMLGLGRGGGLSRSFPRFSYLVKNDGIGTDVWFPQPQAAPGGVGGPATRTTPLFSSPAYPSRYYVQIISVWVGQVPVMQLVPPQNPSSELTLRPDGTGGVYLSTTEPDTYLDAAVYDRLKAALVQQIKNLNPVPGNGRLCYPRAALQAPAIQIFFARNNNVVGMAAMEPPPTLVGDVWYTEGSSSSSALCLAILPTPPGQTSTIGTRLQRGATMTIDLTATPGGTLTLSR